VGSIGHYAIDQTHMADTEPGQAARLRPAKPDDIYQAQRAGNFSRHVTSERVKRARRRALDQPVETRSRGVRPGARRALVWPDAWEWIAENRGRR
jgi:hypothetical protein